MRFVGTRAGALRALAIPALLALAAPALHAAPAAHAAGTTRFVSTTGSNTGDCSSSPCATVSYAVSQAVSGDTIKVAPGSYSDEITIPAGMNLTILGGIPQFSAGTVIALKALSPGTTGSVLTVGKGATVSVQGISFTGGTGTTISGNVFGGDIYNNGNLSLIDTTVEGGTAAATTGAALGGGIYSAGAPANPASLLVQFSYVGPNQEVPPGPGIAGNTVSVTTGFAQGGGIDNEAFSTLTVTCSLVLGNIATATGGGNAYGGGISNGAGNNRALTSPAPAVPVVNTGGALVINTEITGNTATSAAGEGGGGAIQNTGAMTLDDDTVDGNTASNTGVAGDAKGGGANTGQRGEVMNVNNTTFSGNSATASGTLPVTAGGIAVNAAGILNLTNATIADNSATTGTGTATGGGVWNLGATANLTNTLLARNTANGTPADCSGTMVDHGGNIDDDGTCGFTSIYSISHDTNIQLGPLTNNGGDVPTQAIPLTSDAMGLALAANCETLTGPTPAPTGTPNADTDARGLPRHAVTRAAAGNGIQGCDSGAYDTGDNITLPITVIGAVPVPGLPGRLGFAASTDTTFPIGYITFQISGSTFTVRFPSVSCPNQCMGTPDVPVPGTATVTLTGVISTAHGAYPMGATVKLTVTVLTTIAPPPASTVTHTVTSITVAVNGTTIATLLPPYQFGTYFIFQLLNKPSAP